MEEAIFPFFDLTKFHIRPRPQAFEKSKAYGMQNDQLDLMVDLVENKFHSSQIYLHHFEDLSIILNFLSNNAIEIELVILHSIKPMNSTKRVTTFHGFFIFGSQIKKKNVQHISQISDGFLCRML